MRTAIVDLAPRREHGQHAGLLLQRFLCEQAAGENGNPDEKRKILQAAIVAAGNSDLREFYKSAFARWEKSLPDLTSANDFATEARLIVGLGSENVLETGIRLHHTYGLPIIPGSALKGLAAHYCHEAWGRWSDGETAPVESKRFRRDWAEEKYEYHRLLFGATDNSGCLIFHDAWLKPDSSNPLMMDVMTPHHPKWLDGTAPPTDFDSPRPVSFVSIGGTFRIAVSWNGPANEKAMSWTQLSFDLLVEALREWGIGGKTSSGYGRLIVAAPVAVSPATVAKDQPVRRPPGTPVIVTIVAEHSKLGKNAFFVQEEGKPRGVLSQGKAPDPLPAIGSSLTVYVNSDDPRSPQYRWDKPQEQAQPGRDHRRPGRGGPPRGRR